jgi:hypothetical protein
VFPGFVINGKIYNGYKTAEEIEKLIPGVVRERANELKQKNNNEKLTTTNDQRN